MDRLICEVHRLGLIDYQEAWDLQNRFASEIAAGNRPATLLLLEHPHTYTFGRRAEPGNLLWSQSELRKRQISTYWVDRGGDVTYHGPGQLVGYPLLSLERISQHAHLLKGDRARIPTTDYVGYIRKLEITIIKALAELGIRARQAEGLTGVWVEMDQPAVSSDLEPYSAHSLEPGPMLAKLAAIGVKVDARGISKHGFALNVNPDMRYWEGIIGCGLPNPQISLADLMDPMPMMEVVMRSVVETFGKIFDYEIK